MALFYAGEISFLAALQVGAAVVLADLTRDQIHAWKEVNEGLIKWIEGRRVGDIASKEPARAMAGQKLEDARMEQKLEDARMEQKLEDARIKQKLEDLRTKQRSEYLHMGEETQGTLKSTEIGHGTVIGGFMNVYNRNRRIHGTEKEVFTMEGKECEVLPLEVFSFSP